MFKLKFKTNGAAGERGKRRVYFCCHPDDFKAFFDEVSDDILERYDCAVWYDPDPAAPYDKEELFSALHEMQLFVMPVTARLLQGKNRALDVEFAYAIEHNIPVLPLMQEGGLEKQFNEKCGDLQFLNKNDRDETAISFDEKLRNYLEAVLLGHELEEKVRAAFAARIFLSYRKKDRKYAQELMRLIHKNEKCRDVAIWYDEFLTPGENFNKEIAKALEDSHLFTMAVTPNLVNEDNYVISNEYPKAKLAKKPMIAAQMVKTDRNEIIGKIPDFPKVIDGYDEKTLASEVCRLLKDRELTKNLSSPKQQHLIGLAYLHGIDVEVDRERALSLITAAANSGSLDAQITLVNMYRDGVGTARNRPKAIELQEKLLKRLCELYQKTPNERAAKHLCGEHEKLAMLYSENGDYKRFYEQTKKNVDFVEGVFKEYGGETMLKLLSNAYQHMGSAAGKTAHHTQSSKHYEKLLEILIKASEEDMPYWLKKEIAVCRYQLGVICRSSGEFDLAIEHFSKHIAFFEAEAESEEKDIDTCIGLNYGYYGLSQLYLSRGLYDVAKKYAKKGIEVAKKHLLSTSNVRLNTHAFLNYYSMAGICSAEGNFSDIRKYYGKCLEMLRKYVEIYDTALEKSIMVEINLHLSVGFRKKDIAFARKNIKDALAIAEDVVEKTPSALADDSLLKCYSEAGSVCYLSNDIEGMRQNYEKCIELCKKVESELEGDEHDEYISYELKFNAIIAWIANDDKILAEQYFKKLIEFHLERAKKGDVKYRRELIEIYHRLADFYEKTKPYASRKYCRKALTLAKEILSRQQDWKSLDELADAYEKKYIYRFAGRKKAVGLNDLVMAYFIWIFMANCFPKISKYRDKAEKLKNTYKGANTPIFVQLTRLFDKKISDQEIPDVRDILKANKKGVSVIRIMQQLY